MTDAGKTTPEKTMPQKAMPQKTMPSRATRDEESKDAQVRAGADEIEGPEAPVDENLDEEVSEHYEDMIEHGVQQRGEGRLP